MTDQKLSDQLKSEGFSQIYVWEDSPNVCYPDHSHAEETAHIILCGQMYLTMAGKTISYCEGQRFDVPAGAVHSAKMGPHGCRYLIGER